MRTLVLAVLLLAACAAPPRREHGILNSGRAGLAASDPAARARAAWELGQLGFVDVPEGETEPATSVSLREEAAAAVLPAVSDPEPPVRRAAVEALGKLTAAGEDVLLSAATDIDAGVRGEVALALFRRRYLKRIPEYSAESFRRLAGLAVDKDAEVRWKAAYAFTRFPDERGKRLVAGLQRDPDARVRLFSARALAKNGREASEDLLSDPDLYVRAEAVASYGAAKKAAALPDSVFADVSAHVRAAAADAVAATGDASLAVKLERMADSDGPLARGRALLALAKLRGAADSARLSKARADSHWWIRARAYEASAALPDAGTILAAGTSDPDARVAAQALETLAASTAPAAGAALERALRDPRSPLELAGTAIDAAAGRKDASLVPALRAAAARTDLTPEIGESLAKALKACGDSSPYKGAQLAPPKAFAPLPAPVSLVLDTEKGEVVLALDGTNAPTHAAAIADAARRGVYDGTIWHRIVTAFVVQGGDPRGSGWGDDGFRLADENSPVPFSRGTLGMPKAGPDTGGVQLFVSLIPTPHLDGRYTPFGRVVSGMDVLDRLEPGDRIRSARPR